VLALRLKRNAQIHDVGKNAEIYMLQGGGGGDKRGPLGLKGLTTQKKTPL